MSSKVVVKLSKEGDVRIACKYWKTECKEHWRKGQGRILLVQIELKGSSKGRNKSRLIPAAGIWNNPAKESTVFKANKMEQDMAGKGAPTTNSQGRMDASTFQKNSKASPCTYYTQTFKITRESPNVPSVKLISIYIPAWDNPILLITLPVQHTLM